MFFHWSLSESKSLQVSRTLLSILADLNNAVGWMVSTCQLISNFSSLLSNPLWIVLTSPITIGITVTFISLVILCSLARSKYIFFFSLYTYLLLLLLLLIIFTPFWVFHSRVSRWFLAGVWVTTSLLKSPGLFSVFWLFSVMLSFG